MSIIVGIDHESLVCVFLASMVNIKPVPDHLDDGATRGLLHPEHLLHCWPLPCDTMRLLGITLFLLGMFFVGVVCILRSKRPKRAPTVAGTPVAGAVTVTTAPVSLARKAQ
jgi:hypothetical protein